MVTTDRKAFTGAVLAAAALAVSHAGPGITALGPVRRRFFRGLSGAGHPGHVALTFDDGPDQATTPGFLDVLARHRAHATFFLLGSMVAKAPGLAADIAAAGHEVAVHGWEHRYAILRSPRAVRDDMTRARDAVADASGVVPRFYRPPYGVLSSGAVAAARSLGLRPVLWTNWGQEWKPGSTPWSVHQAVMQGLAGGACILLHDSDCTSPPGAAAAALGALPRVLEECEAWGLKAGPLAEHGL